MIGSARANYKWQARKETSFEASRFLINWGEKHALCPEGHLSNSWTPARDRRKNEVIKIKFSAKDCTGCPSQTQCTYTGHATRRTLTIRPQEQYFALQHARARQATVDFAKEYVLREGIESTLSQGIRVMGLRRSRYIGASRPICNIWPQRLLSMLYVRSIGSMRNHERGPTPQLLFVFSESDGA